MQGFSLACNIILQIEKTETNGDDLEKALTELDKMYTMTKLISMEATYWRTIVRLFETRTRMINRRPLTPKEWANSFWDQLATDERDYTCWEGSFTFVRIPHAYFCQV